MVSLKATVRNKYGIHCRPSALIAKEAQGYAGTITVTTERQVSAEAKAVLPLVGLGITWGEVVLVSVSGPDEEAVCKRMVALFETNFDFRRDE
jgi:phosphotransferase system HPr (HPr) family protein